MVSNTASNNEKNKTIPWWHTENTKRFGLAVIVILAAFITIGGMLGVQQYVLVGQLDNVRLSNMTQAEATSLINNVTDSNARVFNILVPVFAAWVGSVIAFYFGSTKGNDDKKRNNITPPSTNTQNMDSNYNDESNDDQEGSLNNMPVFQEKNIDFSELTLEETRSKILNQYLNSNITKTDYDNKINAINDEKNQKLFKNKSTTET